MKVNINRHIFSIEPSKGSMVFSGTLTAVIFTIAIMFGFIPNIVLGVVLFYYLHVYHIRLRWLSLLESSVHKQEN